jgi:hypothetical protein
MSVPAGSALSSLAASTGICFLSGDVQTAATFLLAAACFSVRLPAVGLLRQKTRVVDPNPDWIRIQ